MVLMTSQYVHDIHTIAASLHFRHSILIHLSCSCAYFCIHTIIINQPSDAVARQASLLIYSMQISNIMKHGFPSRWQPITIYTCKRMFHDLICHVSLYPLKYIKSSLSTGVKYSYQIHAHLKYLIRRLPINGKSLPQYQIATKLWFSCKYKVIDFEEIPI